MRACIKPFFWQIGVIVSAMSGPIRQVLPWRLFQPWLFFLYGTFHDPSLYVRRFYEIRYILSAIAKDVNHFIKRFIRVYRPVILNADFAD
jgi:hypothetical protein